MRFTRIDRAMRRGGRAAQSLAKTTKAFAERNDVALATGAVCAAIAIPAAVVAAKTTSTVVGVIGGLFAVSYGLGAIGSLAVVAGSEWQRSRAVAQ